MSADEAKAEEAAAPAAEEAPPAPEAFSDKFNELTADNFKEEISKKSALVLFYAPWCGYCKKIKPDWATLSETELEHKGVYAVDCDQEKEICGELGVGGFPTIKYTPDGGVTWEDYQGGRTLEDMKKQVEEMPIEICNPDMTEFCKPEQLEMMKMSDEEKKAMIKSLEPDYKRENLSTDLRVGLLEKLMEVLPSKPEKPEVEPPTNPPTEPPKPETDGGDGADGAAMKEVKESVVKALEQASKLIEKAGSLLNKIV